jgi:hypothetical protein
MTGPLTIECSVHFQRRDKGRKELRAGTGPAPVGVDVPAGRVPRVARLMALALRLDERMRRGELAGHAEVAALGQVTQARVSQIMNLVNLAPDIQEAVLFLPRTVRGRDALHLRQLQPIASTLDWRTQRLLWRELLRARGVDPGG